ncbi:hypothetical protein H924_11375 [Corynebacterium callunae DSM 20147]|uniref:Uncharacterized protein n=1 Tax=Corynebacterium callunae DSM 20147 TaxID=1121353 RepID=M1V0B6_9CORY|nr:hypothetical protein H924_11375 [Corynebacterium callunae DSM 20147]
MIAGSPSQAFELVAGGFEQLSGDVWVRSHAYQSNSKYRISRIIGGTNYFKTTDNELFMQMMALMKRKEPRGTKRCSRFLQGFKAPTFQ